MMKVLLLILLLLLPFAASADQEYDGTLKLTVIDLPKFEDYKTDVRPSKQAKDIDFQSDKNTWFFRTRLREGLKKGAVLAGKYAVAHIGCGTECGSNVIINVETGKVVGTLNDPSSSLYRLDSKLIVTNWYAGDMPFARDGRNKTPSTHLPITFYTVENDKITKLYSIAKHQIFAKSCQFGSEPQNDR